MDGLRASIVGLREDVKELKERLGLKQRELSGLENEYQIVRLQVGWGEGAGVALVMGSWETTELAPFVGEL